LITSPRQQFKIIFKSSEHGTAASSKKENQPSRAGPNSLLHIKSIFDESTLMTSPRQQFKIIFKSSEHGCAIRNPQNTDPELMHHRCT
jgi:hypothetical protein